MYNMLVGLSRRTKQLTLLCIDTILILGALYFAFALRLGTIYPQAALEKIYPQAALENALNYYLSITLLGLCLIVLLGLSRIKLGAFERNAILRTGLCAIGLAIICSVISFFTGYGAPRSIPIIFGVLFFAGSIFIRMTGQFFLEFLSFRRSDRKRVLIYGAGQAGIQLASALRQKRDINLVAFVDDNSDLSGLIVSGLSVLSPGNIEVVIANKKIDQIIIAIPSMNDQRRIELITQLTEFECEVQTIPSFAELIEGKGLLDSLKSVSSDDLLERDKIDLYLAEIDRTYAGKSVMVTGAGGSIGSELCRQLVNCGIRSLILFEHSEYALYLIERELLPIANDAGVKLVPVLGSITDNLRVEAAFRANDVQIVLHAAAYKHVPLVEANEIAGLHNNVIGTRIVADIARKVGLERFILISTDKAVRPTNIMGSSKRLAELIVQDFAARYKSTLFSMVRFGNVLGSSGSVVPLFQEQIAKGGPITLTDGKVTRYFMTITEAARLVLLAGSFSCGGDVFVLDMGKPIKIYNLACSMIKLSGKTVCDADNPKGDIEIKVTGLRPGEKLYEELLIGNEMLTTPHSKIFRAQESSLSEIEMANVVRDLIRAFEADDAVSARNLIARWVEGYQKTHVSKA